MNSSDFFTKRQKPFKNHQKKIKMSVLVIIESPSNQISKAAKELTTYGKKTANLLNTECIALLLGDCEDAGSLGVFGADKVLVLKEMPNVFDSQAYTKMVIS